MVGGLLGRELQEQGWGEDHEGMILPSGPPITGDRYFVLVYCTHGRGTKSIRRRYFL